MEAFVYNDVGHLQCEQVDLTELQEKLCYLQDRPFFAYSKAKIISNIRGI